ncbi:MAG: exodeoxyribonuclease III [bacterium]|nr:MAG: exodeoxyribonuclease III [bacterium]
MNTIRILSWNVNGLRAVYNKNFLEWFLKEQPDILCLQETKSQPGQLPDELTNVVGYHAYFSSAERKGYSGVAIYSKQEPADIKLGMDIKRFDSEGRIIFADYKQFSLFNVYFPNGKQSEERLIYKMDFYDAFLDYAVKLKEQGKRLIICGDVNTAHTEIDLARPRENEKISGFLPQERAWIDKFLSYGFIDTFRMFHKDGGHYTWWDLRTRARERDVGWRIDYFYISENLQDNVKSAFIQKEIMGSDHCPLGIEIAL